MGKGMDEAKLQFDALSFGDGHLNASQASGKLGNQDFTWYKFSSSLPLPYQLATFTRLQLSRQAVGMPIRQALRYAPG
jgi:hypothetical protein